jgi:ceramide glucosyltransferase
VHVAEVVLVGVVAFSAAAYVLMHVAFVVGLWRGRRTAAARVARATWTPRVTVLKPLAGAEDELSANLESLARLDWPDLEILLGVASPADPAAPVARAFLAAHPALRARLVVTDPRAALNPKVAQLVGLVSEATGEVLVVSDANVRVPRDYLRHLVATLEEPGVGLVTSVIAGTGERTLGAALENLQLCAYAAPGVVGGSTLTGRCISIGKSMAMRASDLVRVGGFERVGGVLAEDHVLGQIFHAHGLGVRVCAAAVENRNVACTTRRTFERHARWGRMRRFIAPHGFYLEPLLSPLAVACVGAAILPGRLALGLVVGAAILHVSGASLSMALLRGRVPAWVVPLELLRVAVAMACWVAAIASRTVVWRGRALSLRPGSILVPAGPGVLDRLRHRRMLARAR